MLKIANYGFCNKKHEWANLRKLNKFKIKISCLLQTYCNSYCEIIKESREETPLYKLKFFFAKLLVELQVWNDEESDVFYCHLHSIVGTRAFNFNFQNGSPPQILRCISASEKILLCEIFHVLNLIISLMKCFLFIFFYNL